MTTLSSLRIAFMGTPDFAVPALRALIGEGYGIQAVYSQPPRPKGRGYKLQKSPVQEVAESYHIPVLTPASLRTPEAQADFKALDLDIAIVAAYGLILPKEILTAPRHGCINIHGSLLPRWRGAAPIQRAILAGDTLTGVTIMDMDVGLDTGPMILKKEIAITPLTTASSLHDEMAEVGAQALMEALPSYLAGTLIPQPQPEDGVTYAAKIEKEEGHLTWNLPADLLVRKVRALTPWPGVWFTVAGKRIKVLEAQEEDVTNTGDLGTIIDDHLGIMTASGLFRPLSVQPEGGTSMSVEAFLRGHPLLIGTQL